MVSVYSDKVCVGPHFVVTVFTEPDVAWTAGRPREFAWQSQPFHGTFLSTYLLHYKQNRIPKVHDVRI